MSKPCEICKIVRGWDENNSLLNTDCWTVILSYEQSYLGRAMVCLNRHVGSLGALTETEVLDWYRVVKIYESVLRKAFGVTLFNWGCLTNNAFQERPYNPHVHWHVRPRYDHPVEVAGMTFEDPTFGHPFDRGRKLKVGPEVQRQIKSLINFGHHYLETEALP